MNHTPADIVQALLVDLGVGSDGGATWPINVDVERSAPDETLTVYNTTAQADGRAMPTGDVLQHWGIQVRVRARTHEAGWQKAWAVREALAKQVANRHVTLDSASYMVAACAKLNIVRMGVEAGVSKRRLFTVNCVAAIRAM